MCRCEHYTELNLTEVTRVSIDFRVIRPHELHLAPVRGADDEAPTSTPSGASEDGAGQGGERGREQARQIGSGQRTEGGAKEYFRVGRYYRRLPPMPACALTTVSPS